MGEALDTVPIRQRIAEDVADGVTSLFTAPSVVPMLDEIDRLRADREKLIAAGVRVSKRFDPNAIDSGRATEASLERDFLELAGVAE